MTIDLIAAGRIICSQSHALGSLRWAETVYERYARLMRVAEEETK